MQPDLSPDPFPIMTYKDAMDNYGTDKPDTRFDMNVSGECCLSCSNTDKMCGLDTTYHQGYETFLQVRVTSAEGSIGGRGWCVWCSDST